MAETFRAPKAIQEEAQQNQEIMIDVSSALSIRDVFQMSRSWNGEKGREWSLKIISNLAERSIRALMTSEEDAMAVTDEVPDLNEELTELLADVFSFYLRAHGAHWNVVGTDFAEYHKLFNDIYDDVYSSIDPIAENLRKLGSKAPFTLPQFIALRTLQDSNITSSDARVLATDLLNANDVVILGISDAFDCATECGQQGIANFLAERLDKHQMWKWQLSASLGIEPAPLDLTEESPEEQEEEGIEEEQAPMDSPKEFEPMDITDRASAARIGEGSFVSWSTTDGRNRGKVEKVITKGPATSSEGFVIEATPEFPVFSIRIYKQQGNGWIPTDVVVVHRNDYLTVIGALPAPRSEEMPMIEERKSAIASAEKLTMNAEVRAIDTEDGSLRIGGYAATFNQEADGLNFREVIAPGAFTCALASGDPVFLLVNHDMEGIPLASTQSGTLQLRQDKVGLYIEAELDPQNPRAQELTSALRRGDMDKMSFAFTVAPDGQTKESGLRTLTEIERLYEVSVVTLPAYSSTSVGMRSADDDLEVKKKKLAIKVKQYSLRSRKA